MRKFIALGFAMAAVMGLAACSNTTSNVNTKNAATINNDIAQLQRAEPLPTILDSADLRIQNYYYTAEADPNKIWYLETLSMTGSVEASYTIRGPVENVSDQVTNPYQLECIHWNDARPDGCGVIGLAEPNGVFPGTSDDHIAILVSGAILRFEGQFQTSDQPFTIHTPAILTVNANAPISPTDLSKTVGGKIPTRGGTNAAATGASNTP